MPRGQIAARLCPRRQVEPAVVCLEEQLDQQGAEQEQPQEGLLEVEEGHGAWIAQAVDDDLVEPLLDLLLQLSDEADTPARAFLTTTQGLTITRRLQSNGLHPFQIGGFLSWSGEVSSIE